eukprot:UN30176
MDQLIESNTEANSKMFYMDDEDMKRLARQKKKLKTVQFRSSSTLAQKQNVRTPTWTLLEVVSSKAEEMGFKPPVSDSSKALTEYLLLGPAADLLATGQKATPMQRNKMLWSMFSNESVLEEPELESGNNEETPPGSPQEKKKVQLPEVSSPTSFGLVADYFDFGSMSPPVKNVHNQQLNMVEEKVEESTEVEENTKSSELANNTAANENSEVPSLTNEDSQHLI